MVFPEFVLGGAQPRSRYVKPDGKLPGEEWTPERPVDAGDLKAVSYLPVLFSSKLSRPALLQSDIEFHDEFNKDFVSVGFGSNAKTRGVFDNDGNRVTKDSSLIEVDVAHSRIKSLRGKEFLHEPGFDYAVILKIHPEQYKDRIWIVCAGERGEGTPPAGWFLANKWQELHKRAKGRPFAAVLKAKVGQDQSTLLVDMVL